MDFLLLLIRLIRQFFTPLRLIMAVVGVIAGTVAFLNYAQLVNNDANLPYLKDVKLLCELDRESGADITAEECEQAGTISHDLKALNDSINKSDREMYAVCASIIILKLLNSNDLDLSCTLNDIYALTKQQLEIIKKKNQLAELKNPQSAT